MSKKEKINSGFFDYLRFGESYTSLLLGIVVVIVSTVLLLSFVHNKNVGTKTTPNNQQAKTMVQATASPSVTSSPTAVVSPTSAANNESAKIAKVTTSTVAKDVSPTAKPTVKPTVAPTKAPTQLETKVEPKGTYTVKKGDTLWNIAEKEYKSGYNWVDIASANKLNNPNAIHTGNKLVLPKVKSKVATATVTKVTPTPTVVKAKATPTSQVQKDKKVDQKAVQPKLEKITGATYTVVKGDHLWNIAIRAYGDGYQWVKISQANKLVNPNLIYPGNKFTLPRGK